MVAESSWLSLYCEASARRESRPAWEDAKLLLPQKAPHVRRIVLQIHWSMNNFLPEQAWGSSSENEKFESVWLLTGRIKSTWLPWQDPWWGDSAAHLCKHVFHFCPKGSGLISLLEEDICTQKLGLCCVHPPRKGTASLEVVVVKGY